jgi:hypothetical protein
MGKITNHRHIGMGTVDNLCIYEMWGKVYYRKKSSLTRKRVLKDRKFEKTRKHASEMGRAARIGSVIYKAMPEDIKDRWIYRAITGEAASLLYQGKEEEEVKAFLWKKYIEDTDCREQQAKEAMESGRCSRNVFPSTPEANLSLRKIFEQRWEKQGRSTYWFKQAWQKRGYFNPDRFTSVMNYLGPIWRRAYKS